MQNKKTDIRLISHGAQIKLRHLIASPEWAEIANYMLRSGPRAEVSRSADNNIEYNALKGAESLGWNRAINHLEFLSEPKLTKIENNERNVS